MFPPQRTRTHPGGPEHAEDARLVRISGGSQAWKAETEEIKREEIQEKDIQVEVAHEALLRNWPQLVDWLSEQRAAIVLRQRLESKVAEWVHWGRSRTALLDEVQLREAQRWPNSVDEVELGVIPDLQALIEASRKALEDEQQLKEETEKRARDRDLAIARQLGLAALNNIATDPERSLLLAVEAAERTRERGNLIIEAEDALHQALLASRALQTLSTHTKPINSVAFSKDGMLASAGADGCVILWDLASDRHPRSSLLGMHLGPVNKVAFSPDGKRLASAAADGYIKLWDVHNRTQIAEMDAKSACLNNLNFSSDGMMLATAGSDGAAKLWDAVGFDLRLMSSLNDVSGMPTEGKNLVSRSRRESRAPLPHFRR